MKDKLRELAERWKARPGRVFTENHMLNAGVVMGKCECADELLAILDAEGDGGAVAWSSLSESNRTMHGEFCSLLSDLQREWVKEGAEDGSDAIDAAYEALHQFVSRLSTHPHSPDAADCGPGTLAMVDALRKIAAIRWQSAAINGCAHEAAKIASADLESALAQPASPEQPAGRQWDVWVVADGGRDGENRFRTLKEGMPAWTLDQDDAIQFARRDDAERFAAEDEDAWRILPIPQSAAPVGVPDGMVLVPAKFGIKADAWEAAQFVFGGPGTGEGESFMDCTAWIGEVVDEDDGTKTHGLHVSCNECPEEGSITLAEFAAAPSAPQEKEQPE